MPETEFSKVFVKY